MTHIASTKREEDIPREVIEAKAMRDKTATIAGCSVEIQILKQQMRNLLERLDRTEKLYMTMHHEFEQFRQQRAIELARLVGGGPTA